jgi:hypothetical protein
MTPCPKGDPLMIAWAAYNATEEYANAKRWAAKPEHVDGSLWAVFEAGFRAATERAANLHEQVDSASDAERLEKLPGAGAMGAVIEYRDKIRQTIAAE